jgi:hypothetical protein
MKDTADGDRNLAAVMPHSIGGSRRVGGAVNERAPSRSPHRRQHPALTHASTPPARQIIFIEGDGRTRTDATGPITTELPVGPSLLAGPAPGLSQSPRGSAIIDRHRQRPGSPEGVGQDPLWACAASASEREALLDAREAQEALHLDAARGRAAVSGRRELRAHRVRRDRAGLAHLCVRAPGHDQEGAEAGEREDTEAGDQEDTEAGDQEDTEASEQGGAEAGRGP